MFHEWEGESWLQPVLCRVTIGSELYILEYGRNTEQLSHTLVVPLLSANVFDNIIILSGGSHATQGCLELTVSFKSFSYSKVQCS